MRRPRRVPGAIPLLVALLTVTGCRDEHEASPTPAPAPAETAADAAPAPAALEPLPAGLEIEILTEGRGEACPPGATVTVEYTAMLSDGDVWDSTERRRRPMTWDLGTPGLIEGLRRAVPGMRPGERRRVHIASPLAYGSTGRPPIPPDEDLIFEITLLSWQ